VERQAVRLAKRLTVIGAVTVVVALGGPHALRFIAVFQANRACCQLPPLRNAVVSLKELRGTVEFAGEIGQDKWVLEKVFPGVTDGFFLDVGSSHGQIGSNSWALERRGWTGICVDPFPIYMEGRTCQMFNEVVFSASGKRVSFRAAGGLGGVGETLAPWNTKAEQAPSVEFTSVSLRDLLTRAEAPAFIHFVSMDIEGAEFEALRGFPFDGVAVGAWAIEHNFEEPKRGKIKALLEQHGYTRVHAWRQDDFYVPVTRR
jgi:FkbM family methyltransferase